jgi:hypothetical protein
MTFTLRRDRDEGNFRFFLEKALGDALQNGGWLKNDTPDQYRFSTVDFEIGDQKRTIIRIDYEP